MKSLQKIREELVEAKASIEEMKKARDLVSYEKAWKLFLIRLERVWNKLCNHLCKSPKYKSWSIIDQAKQLRKNDPLLSYLTIARGADEHTIDEITEKQPGGIGINLADPNEHYIEHIALSAKNGNITIKSKQPLKVDFIPEKLKLNSVANRSGISNPPTTHLGNPIKSVEPIDIAEAGLDFYEDLIKKAEEHFLK
jgi:hypothetical protein